MQANGKREARYLACGGSKTRPRWIARDVAHESDCNVRRDGSSAASVQQEQPSMSAEDCTAHQNS